MSTGFLPFFTIAATPSSRCHSLLRCCSRVIDMSASQSSSVTSSFPSNRTSTWRNNSFVVLHSSGSNVERPSMGRPRWQSRRQCQVASAAAIPQGIAIGEEEEWLHLPTMVGVRGAVQGAHRPPRPPPPSPSSPPPPSLHGGGGVSNGGFGLGRSLSASPPRPSPHARVSAAPPLIRPLLRLCSCSLASSPQPLVICRLSPPKPPPRRLPTVATAGDYHHQSNANRIWESLRGGGEKENGKR